MTGMRTDSVRASRSRAGASISNSLAGALGSLDALAVSSYVTQGSSTSSPAPPSARQSPEPPRSSCDPALRSDDLPLSSPRRPEATSWPSSRQEPDSSPTRTHLSQSALPRRDLPAWQRSHRPLAGGPTLDEMRSRSLAAAAAALAATSAALSSAPQPAQTMPPQPAVRQGWSAIDDFTQAQPFAQPASDDSRLPDVSVVERLVTPKRKRSTAKLGSTSEPSAAALRARTRSGSDAANLPSSPLDGRSGLANARATSLQLEEVFMAVEKDHTIRAVSTRAQRAGRLGVGRAPLLRTAHAPPVPASPPSPYEPAISDDPVNDATQLPLRSEASFDSAVAKAESQPPGNAESTPPDELQTQPRVQFALHDSPDMPLDDPMSSPPPPMSLFDAVKSNSTQQPQRQGAHLTTTFTTNVTSPTSSLLLPSNPKARVDRDKESAIIDRRVQRDATAQTFRAQLLAQKREERAAAAASSGITDDTRDKKSVFDWAETQDVTDPSISIAATCREQKEVDEVDEYQIGAKSKGKTRRSVVKPAIPTKVREQEGRKQRMIPKGVLSKPVIPTTALAQPGKRTEVDRRNVAGPSISKRQQTRSPSPATQPPIIGSPEAESQTESEREDSFSRPFAVPWTKGIPLVAAKPVVGEAVKRNLTDPGPAAAAKEQTQSSCTQESVTEDASSVTEDAESQPRILTSPPRLPPAPITLAKRRKLNEALSPPPDCPPVRPKGAPLKLSNVNDKQSESSRSVVRRPVPLRAAEEANTTNSTTERVPGASRNNSTGNASLSRSAVLDALASKKERGPPARTASAPNPLSGVSTSTTKAGQGSRSLARGTQSSSGQAPAIFENCVMYVYGTFEPRRRRTCERILKHGGKIVDEFTLTTRLSITHVIGVPVSAERGLAIEIKRWTEKWLPDHEKVTPLPSHTELRRRAEFARCEVLHVGWINDSIKALELLPPTKFRVYA